MLFPLSIFLKHANFFSLSPPPPFPMIKELLHEAADLLSIYLSRDMKDMKDDQLLLVHGTADENVQLVHTMLLTKKLTYYGIVFNQMVNYLEFRHNLRNIKTTFYKIFPDCDLLQTLFDFYQFLIYIRLIFYFNF